MKEFFYKIKDEIGIHARPAGMLVKAATGFSSSIKLRKGEKTADAKKIFSVMGLAAKKDDELKIEIDGSDEDAALSALKAFFEENL